MNKKNSIDLSISIVSFNTKNHLQKCLNSIYKYTKGITFEIFVVDNGSSDESMQMVTKDFPNVHLIKNSENLFFTKANNQALRRAKGKYILILNSDTRMHPGTLAKGVAFLEKHPRVGALGIKHVGPHGRIDQTCQRFTHPIHEFFHSNILMSKLYKPKMLQNIHYTSWNRLSSRYVDAVSDACLFAPRHVLATIGWYDERFLLFFTENDLCLRIQKAGYHMYHLANASITHVRNQSVKQLKSTKAYTIYEHDMLAYYRKYFGVSGWLFLYLTSQINRIYYFLEPCITYIRRLKTAYGKT